MANLDGCVWAETLVILTTYNHKQGFHSSLCSCLFSVRLYLPPRNKVSIEISGRLLRIFCLGNSIGTPFPFSDSSPTVLIPNKVLFLYRVNYVYFTIDLFHFYLKKNIFHWQLEGLIKMTLFLKQSFQCTVTSNYCRFVLMKANIIFSWRWM